MSVRPLDGTVRPYAWSSRTALAGLRGEEPSGEPEAELWLGAHPAGPASLDGGAVSLLEHVEADPHAVLGSGTVATFGPRLPFLLKVLAADAPLSLQVHPTRERAALGHAAEESRGVPTEAPHRLYGDPYPKPELVVAVTPFAALCGFRTAAEALDLVRGLGCRALAPVLAAMEAASDGPSALRAGFTALVRLGGDDAAAREHLVEQVVAAARERTTGPDDDGPYAWVGRLAAHHPGDPGVAAPLLVRTVVLQPDEGLYLPAGNVHAYVSGTAIELMGASDNVLRAGLTGKHVDVDELLDVVAFSEEPVEVLTGAREGDEQVWTTDAPEFRLSRIDLEPGRTVRLQAEGPEVLLSLSGGASVVEVGPQGDGAGAVALGRCGAAFVDAGTAVVVRGSGAVWRATCGA